MNSFHMPLNPGTYRRSVGPDVGIGGIDHHLIENNDNSDAERNKEAKKDKKFSRFFHSHVFLEVMNL